MALHTNSKGLDLPIAGAPAEPACADAIEHKPVARVALLGVDSPGLRAALRVEPGARVRRGEPLFDDRRNPGITCTAPAAGTVRAIHRGERRAFLSLVIAVGDDDADDSCNQVAFASHDALAGCAPDTWTGAQVRALLLESGLWTALRARPYSRVAAPDSRPAGIFVTAIDTRPHAPSLRWALAGRDDDWRAGLLALVALAATADAPVYVCQAAGAALPLPAHPRLHAEQFAGPHPAGNAGWHIHRLAPVDSEHMAWHIGYADVLAAGRLCLSGRLDVERIVALAGPGVACPRLLRTRLGASTDLLAEGELRDGEQRLIAGSVLDGRAASGDVHGYLGRHHLQLSALPEGRQRELLGWIAPGADRFSISRVVLGALRRGGGGLPLTTSTHGGARAMVPIGHYERVLPFDIAPTFLLRALITGDDERAAALGALELDEEDIALATFACPGKTDYGPLLRAALARIEKEG